MLPIDDNIKKRILHELAALGESLSPNDPHLYAVADLQECPNRRWLTLPRLINEGYLQEYHKQVFESAESPEWALYEVSSVMMHLVLGGVLTCFLVSGRVWEVGPENLGVRTNVLGGFDWHGARRPNIRVLANDPYVKQLDRRCVIERDEDMADWIMLQAIESLEPILAEVARLSDVHQVKCWKPLPDMIRAYNQVSMKVFSERKETVDLRTQHLFDSAERLGVYRRGSHTRLI